jgi:hypothetical protein
LNANPSAKPTIGRNLVGLAAVSLVLVSLLLFALGTFNPPAASTSAASSTSASFAADASGVIASIASRAPAGYTQGSTRQLNPNEAGLQSGAYSVFSTQAGSSANMTILVFDTPKSANNYISSVVSNAKGLSGYTDVSQSLANYQHYGLCYGFGQTDPYGNGAVTTGVCTKGNVYIQVHVVSPSSLSSAVEGLSNLVGAAYQAVN